MRSCGNANELTFGRLRPVRKVKRDITKKRFARFIVDQ